MITVTYNNIRYECTVAIRGATYIHLLDNAGYAIKIFSDVTDFSAFTIEGGTWTVPSVAYDCYVETLGSKCDSYTGTQMRWNFDSFNYFQNFIDMQTARSEDKHYVHNQNVPSSTWEIVHNLGKAPSITVVDSAGTVVVGECTYSDTNKIVVSFSGAFAGKAYLN